MGCGASTADAKKYSEPAWRPIPDQFTSYGQVTEALRKSGLESSQLIIGVDFTASNKETGRKTYGGRCLHDTSQGANPYEQVMRIMANVLSDFDDDNLIPAFGFGDIRTRHTDLFSFQKNEEPCDGLGGVVARYGEIAAKVELAGPTSFAALIKQAIKIVAATGEYHILLIIADGQVNEPPELYVNGLSPTAAAIVEASNYALSIVMVGVGDGPWDAMETFDDELPQRKFDNFQFVNFSEVWAKYPARTRDSAFAVHALMEVPDQYSYIKQNNLLRVSQKPVGLLPRVIGPPGSTSIRNSSKSRASLNVSSNRGGA
jgi:E3 ubiquitin-protein ligase RGLG